MNMSLFNISLKLSINMKYMDWYFGVWKSHITPTNFGRPKFHAGKSGRPKFPVGNSGTEGDSGMPKFPDVR